MSEYSTGLVHCDFNEFNLLINDEEKVTVRAARPRERWSTHTLSRARVCAFFRARPSPPSRARACTNTQLISSKETDDDAVPRLETIGRPCASVRLTRPCVIGVWLILAWPEDGYEFEWEQSARVCVLVCVLVCMF